MISVREAIDIILGKVEPGPATRVPLAEAHGLVLAADATSDTDMPPFHKSFVDGFAVRAEDTSAVPVDLVVVGKVPAGSVPDFEIGPGEAAKVMTGAPLPKGATAVQMVEQTLALADSGKVRLLESVSEGKNVAPRGSDVRKGDIVARAGTVVTPAVVAVLAAVGCVDVPVYRRLDIAVLTTGDELVEPQYPPPPGRIRNSNGPMLLAQITELSARPCDLGIAGDDRVSLQRKISEGLEKDVLLVTGGVSMGELDLVEEVFQKLGVRILFDKVAIKPGKPTVFGHAGKTMVFGLPGNPVSALTVFEILVRPAVRKRMGFSSLHLPRIRARMIRGFEHRSGREDYHPAWTHFEDGEWLTEPVPTHGSADLVAFARSNSFVVVPRDVERLPADEQVEVVLRQEYGYV